MNELTELVRAIEFAKCEENAAKAKRRELQDKFMSLAGIATEGEGSETVKPDGWKVTVTRRVNYKIDADKLQELASEADLTDQLSTLFRWKPSLNLRLWKETDAGITAPLASAIESKQGQPTFKIERIES